MSVNMMWMHVIILLLVKTASPTPIGKKSWRVFCTLINILDNFCFMFKEILKGLGESNRLGRCFKMYEKNAQKFGLGVRNRSFPNSNFFLTVLPGAMSKTVVCVDSARGFLSAAMLNHRLQK